MKNWTLSIKGRKHFIPDHPRKAWNTIRKIVGMDNGSTEGQKSILRSITILDSSGRDRTTEAVRSISEHLQVTRRHIEYAKIDRQKARNVRFLAISTRF